MGGTTLGEKGKDLNVGLSAGKGGPGVPIDINGISTADVLGAWQMHLIASAKQNVSF